MEVETGSTDHHHQKKKANPILKKLERILSINRRAAAKSSTTGNPTTATMFTKSRSWHSSNMKKTRGHNQTAPDGCFSVYVGPEKQRFVIKTEFANHPLFKMLLDDAESEYGFKLEGPLLLPCGVDLFWKVLAEMDGGDHQESDDGFGYGCCSPFSPARRLGRSSTSYGLLTPPRSLKINNF